MKSIEIIEFNLVTADNKQILLTYYTSTTFGNFWIAVCSWGIVKLLDKYIFGELITVFICKWELFVSIGTKQQQQQLDDIVGLSVETERKFTYSSDRMT